MVTMEQLQDYMRKSATEDKARKYVNVSGATLEEALREAAIELGVPIKRIEYEILDKGSKGVMGVGKKPTLIVAYPAAAASDHIKADGSFDMDFGFDAEGSQDENGKVFVRLSPQGVLVKVTAPVGSGEPVTERYALQAVERRTNAPVDRRMLADVVDRADGEWVPIGDHDYNPANDAYLSCDIIEGEMKATVTIAPPGPGGADPTADAIRGALEASGVEFGFLEDKLNEVEDNPRFNEPIVVAEGKKPVHGTDAHMAYNFKTEGKAVRVQENKDGRVDFREINKIENVVEGQVLARKVPATAGEPGRTVTGKLIPARDGKDMDPPLGPNTRLSDDGRTVLAEINGLVKLVSGKITVEPIYVVNGDVNIKEGNVRFLGTVIIKGNVDDGFAVNAAGDIEVMGHVGKSVLEAEGDVIVHQGVAGKGDGSVTAGGSVWAKFIENSRIDAGDMVVVSDGIINSTVFSNSRIVCRGKRASIVGGHIRASEEIDAKTLGSVAGMETLLEVGYDPKSKEKLIALEKKDEQVSKQLDELQLNMSTIENMRKQGRKISPEKIKQYTVMKAKRDKLLKARHSIAEERDSIQGYLEQLKVNGRISASATVFTGVKITIKDANLPIRNEMKAVTFVAEGGTVKVTKYEESRADISVKRREGGVSSAD